MKKRIIILLIILIFPIFAYADDQFTKYYAAPISIDVIENHQLDIDTYYGNEISYENGQYTLSGTLKQGLSQATIKVYYPNDNIVYTCKSRENLSCEEVLAVNYKHELDDGFLRGYLGIKLKNGETFSDRENFYVSKEYEYNEGVYTLVNYETHNISEIRNTNFLGSYKGYYYCPSTNGTSCTDLVSIVSGGRYKNYAEKPDNYHLLAEGYQYIDGKYKLINPEKALLATTSNRTGYTCMSKEEVCEEVYYVEISENYVVNDGGRRYTYTKIYIPNEIETNTIKLMVGEAKMLEPHFTEEEINTIKITNPEIIEIKEGKIIAKKVGETILIYEDNDTYKELKIIINEEDLNNIENLENPKTGINISILIIAVLAIILAINYKKYDALKQK